MSATKPDRGPLDMVLRPFGRGDFGRLISWVASEAALTEWCAAFFRFPLDEAQLEAYLESSKQANGRAIFAAQNTRGDVVGHVEISHIWPHLSSRLSRVLVSPLHRRRGLGTVMVAEALAFSFREHKVARIDVGVSLSNDAAISCYRKLGFDEVGTWPAAMTLGGQAIEVSWMTMTKDAWAGSPINRDGKAAAKSATLD